MKVAKYFYVGVACFIFGYISCYWTSLRYYKKLSAKTYVLMASNRLLVGEMLRQNKISALEGLNNEYLMDDILMINNFKKDYDFPIYFLWKANRYIEKYKIPTNEKIRSILEVIPNKEPIDGAIDFYIE